MSEKDQVSPSNENPDYAEQTPNAEDIDVAYFDKDNCLYNFTKMRTVGVEAMANVVSNWASADIDLVRKDMGYVFNAYGTFDVPYLLENMPIVYERLFNIMRGYEDPEMGLMHATIEFARLLDDTRDAYHNARAKEYKLYPGIKEVFEALSTRMRIAILTDAPIEKTIKRLHDFGLEKYVSALYGQPQPRFQLTEIPEFPPDLEKLRQKLLKLREVNKNLPPHGRPEKLGNIINQVQYEVVKMFDRKKPNIDLSKLERLKPGRSVENNVMVVGDNPAKDMELAINNNCYGLWARWGLPLWFEREIMYSYGTDDETVDRNLPKESDIKRTEGQEQAGETIKQIRTKIIELTHPIQILDVLGIERPDKFKSKS